MAFRSNLNRIPALLGLCLAATLATACASSTRTTMGASGLHPIYSAPDGTAASGASPASLEAGDGAGMSATGMGSGGSGGGSSLAPGAGASPGGSPGGAGR